MAIVVCEAEEAQFSRTTTQTGQHDTTHFDGDGACILPLWCEGDDEHATSRDGDESENPYMVWYLVNEVGCAELGEERRDHVGEEDDTFGDPRAYEVEGSGENDDIEDVVNKTFTCKQMFRMVVLYSEKMRLEHGVESTALPDSNDSGVNIPNNQKAAQTLGSAPSNMAARRAR